MQNTKAVTVLLSYSLLMFNVTHGALTDFSEEFRNTKGQILALLNQVFNRSYYSEADYLQAWINLQVCKHINTIIYIGLKPCVVHERLGSVFRLLFSASELLGSVNPESCF